MMEEVLGVLIETPILASHADREFTSAQLQEHVGAGRLTLDEFSERAAAVYQARTVGELQALLRDLPLVSTGPASSSSGWPRSAVIAAAVLLVLLLGVLLVALFSTGAVGGGGPGGPGVGTMHDMMRGMMGG